MKLITVTVAAWDGRQVTMREANVGDLLETENATTPTQRAVAMLGRMILDDDGNSIGAAAVREMPIRAFAELQLAMNEQIDGGEDKPAPLPRANGSDTASPSP